MKRLTALGLAVVCTLSLAACGSRRPSLEDVEKAISEGTVTVEDALENGWITQEWVDEYVEQNSIPAGNKLDAGAIGAFSTTTLSGEGFTREQMADVTLFAFLDPDDPNAEAFFQALLDGYEDVKKAGAEILVCTKSEDDNGIFEDAPFPVIGYNGSLKDAVETRKDMIEGMPNTASWCLNASFFSAWYSTIEAEELADSADDFVKMHREMTNGDSSESGGMAVMG